MDLFIEKIPQKGGVELILRALLYVFQTLESLNSALMFLSKFQAASELNCCCNTCLKMKLIQTTTEPISTWNNSLF